MQGHPHEALLNGLIEAAVAKNNKCTVLLSTDSVLHSRRLPDPNEWKDYVKFMSLDEGSASIDPETIKIENPRVYNPHSTNNDSWECISNTLNKSSTSEYFRKWVGESKETCKIRINSTGKLYFLFVNSSSEFEVQKSEAIVNVVFDFNEKDIGISVTYKKSTVNYNADKYYLYKSKGGIRDYLHCVNKTRKLEWGEGVKR